MKNTYIFPVVMMGLMVCAGIVYAIAGDYKRAFYWIAVAIANGMVTF